MCGMPAILLHAIGVCDASRICVCVCVMLVLHASFTVPYSTRNRILLVPLTAHKHTHMHTHTNTHTNKQIHTGCHV